MKVKRLPILGIGERPSELCNNNLNNGFFNNYLNIRETKMFGMPSGHSQSSLFSTVFIYLSLRKNNILYFYLIVSLLTITQRVVYDYHNILQVIAGALVGASFGYFVYYLAREKIKGHITEKLDDYGPI